MIYKMMGFSLSSPSIACKQDVKSQYTNISCHMGSVPIKVQYQSDGFSLRSKVGPVIRGESWRRVAAGCLNILRMVVGAAASPIHMSIVEPSV